MLNATPGKTLAQPLDAVLLHGIHGVFRLIRASQMGKQQGHVEIGKSLIGNVEREA